MSWFLAALLSLAAVPQARNLNALPALLDGVQSWFARMTDFSADFEEISVNELNQKGSEKGHVYLKRERMMRWEYKTPRGDKFFISDGKTVYFYVVADKQVYRDPVNKVADGRMPMMFLLGRSNLQDEFTEFSELPEKPQTAGSRVVAMTPRKKSEIREIRMEVDPVSYQVRRLEVRSNDGASMAYRFTNTDDKTRRDSRFFEFKVPAGVTVIDGIR